MAPITMNSSVEVATASSSSSSGDNQEVPIFLQKAYHMIDTCDPTICSWSDDGLTFIVRNTHLFETTIIPQFFKHNKFSSFVRQLNFYGFRKVKFSDSLRIDHKLEAETAKYWRFKHDKFRRGRMDLLTEIKRTPSATTTTTGPSLFVAATTSNKTVVRTHVAASPPIGTSLQSIAQRSNDNPPEEVSHLKSEMQELRQRVESMTKSIDELTDLVKHVSVREQNEEGGGGGRLVLPEAATVEPERGNKRKKTDITTTPSTASLVKHEIDEVMDDLPVIPEWIHSSSDVAGMDLLFSDEPLPHLTTSTSRTGSPAPSDDTFVDDLFQAFVGEESLVPELETDSALDQHDNRNTPDPLLMKRIEDSLSTLPREMHEMVANRLIDAISNTRPVAESASSLFPSCQQSSVCETVTDDHCHIPDGCADSPRPTKAVTAIDIATTKTVPKIPLPLAVATLKTILAEYGVSVECTHRASCKDSAASAENRTMFTKSLPIVPMNA